MWPNDFLLLSSRFSHCSWLFAIWVQYALENIVYGSVISSPLSSLYLHVSLFFKTCEVLTIISYSAFLVSFSLFFFKIPYNKIIWSVNDISYFVYNIFILFNYFLFIFVWGVTSKTLSSKTEILLYYLVYYDAEALNCIFYFVDWSFNIHNFCLVLLNDFYLFSKYFILSPVVFLTFIF